MFKILKFTGLFWDRMYYYEVEVNIVLHLCKVKGNTKIEGLLRYKVFKAVSIASYKRQIFIRIKV